jgi:hypothetical protein
VQLWQDDTLPSGKVRNYLAARGLETEILREYMVGYNPKEVRFDEIKLRIPPGIVIPYWHPALNTLYGVNVRVDQDTLARGRSQTNGMAKYMLASGSKRAPFGIENIAGKRYAFVCEGELDTLLLIQTLRTMGPEAKHIGAFTMGSASSQDPERWLLVYPELLDPVRYLIATDRDEAGQKAAQRWLESTGRARSFPPPSPCKDITELWEKHGYEGVRWWVRAALERFDHQGSQMANS